MVRHTNHRGPLQEYHLASFKPAGADGGAEGGGAEV